MTENENTSWWNTLDWGFLGIVILLLVLSAILFLTRHSDFPNEIPCMPLESGLTCYDAQNDSSVAWQIQYEKVNGKQLSATFNRQGRRLQYLIDGKQANECEWAFYRGFLGNPFMFINENNVLDFNTTTCKNYFDERAWRLLKNFNKCEETGFMWVDASCKWIRDGALN